MRVVTWNLWWRFGPWQERQKAILAVLRELRPDAVGLQEVWQRGDGTGRD
ncbi:endonuclease/exonuclease/phosphatase family protein, partial [Streptomyces scabiei]